VPPVDGGYSGDMPLGREGSWCKKTDETRKGLQGPVSFAVPPESRPCILPALPTLSMPKPRPPDTREATMIPSFENSMNGPDGKDRPEMKRDMVKP